MNPSPLPQPAAQTCPNYGAPANESANFCPNCGAALSPTAKKQGWGSIVGQIGLAFVALCSGLFGACFVVMGVGSIGGTYTTVVEVLIQLGIAAASLGLAAYCVWRMVKKSGKR